LLEFAEKILVQKVCAIIMSNILLEE